MVSLYFMYYQLRSRVSDAPRDTSDEARYRRSPWTVENIVGPLEQNGVSPMRSVPRRILFHILLFIVVLVLLALVPIWLELGPSVHSATGLTA